MAEEQAKPKSKTYTEAEVRSMNAKFESNIVNGIPTINMGYVMGGAGHGKPTLKIEVSGGDIMKLRSVAEAMMGTALAHFKTLERVISEEPEQ